MTATPKNESLPKVSDDKAVDDSYTKNVDHNRKTIEDLVFEAFNVKKRVPTPGSGLTGGVYGKRKSSAKKPVVAVKHGSASKPAGTKKVTIVAPENQTQLLPLLTKNDEQEIRSPEKSPENQEEKEHSGKKGKKLTLIERKSTGFSRKTVSIKGDDLASAQKLPHDVQNAGESEYSRERRTIPKASITNSEELNQHGTRRQVNKEGQSAQRHSFSGAYAHKLLRQIRDSRNNLSELPSNWIKSMRSEDWADVNADEWAKIVTAANETVVHPTQTNVRKPDASDSAAPDQSGNVNDSMDNQNNNKQSAHFEKVQKNAISRIMIQTSSPSTHTSVEKDRANQSMETVSSWTTVSSLSSIDTLHSVGNIETVVTNQDLLSASNVEHSTKVSNHSVHQLFSNPSNPVSTPSDENKQTTPMTNAAELTLTEDDRVELRDDNGQVSVDLTEKLKNIVMEADADTVDELYEVYLPAFQKDPQLNLEPDDYYESEVDTLSCCSEKLTLQGEEAMEQRAWEIQVPEIFEVIRINAGHMSEYAMLNRSTLRAVAVSKNLKGGKPDLVRLMRCLTQLMDPESPKHIGNVVQNSKNTLIPFGNKLYNVTHLDSTSVYARTLTEDYEGFIARPVLGFFIFAFYGKNSHLGVTVDIVNSLVDYVNFCIFGCLPEYEDGFDKITTALDHRHWLNHKKDHEHSAYKSEEIFGDRVDMDTIGSDGGVPDD